MLQLLKKWGRMDKETGKKLIDAAISLDSSVNEIAVLIEQSLKDTELTLFRRGIADISGTIFTSIIYRIVKQHPDLDPDVQG